MKKKSTEIQREKGGREMISLQINIILTYTVKHFKLVHLKTQVSLMP